MPTPRGPGARTGESRTAEADAWKQEFGQRLRGVRQAKGLTQESLAELVGVHRTYAGTVERGEQNVSLTNICQFAKALGVQPEALMPRLKASNG